ncbi:protein of unknown function DUF20 [Loktanella fryxellensis]|uniref:AI-2E family transporter n=1 Tax=Loktanella fryxellensis TaxID=245187 RepID=A0A1H8JR37_9RHOB|nr:protein of unknown function DUF20 [Loktanella fryxellensis]
MAYLCLTAVEGNVATPLLLGRRLELNTVAVFLTVVLWGWLWGIPGALVAVPFLVIFKVIADNVEGMEIVGNFLGAADTPVQNDDTVVETTGSDEDDGPGPSTSAPSVL